MIHLNTKSLKQLSRLLLFPFTLEALFRSLHQIVGSLDAPGSPGLYDSSGNPARILRVPGGSLRAGAPADLALFDFNAEWKIDPAAFASKGKNTPFAGRSVFGKTMYTIVGGRIAWERRKI